MNGAEVADRRCRSSGEFMHVQLPKQDRTRSFEFLYYIGVLRWHAISKAAACRCRTDAGRINIVLDRDRDAVKRPSQSASNDLTLSGPRRLERLFSRDGDKRVKALIDPVDPIKTCFGQLDR